MKTSLVLALGLLATGCASREFLYSVPVISMTESSMAANSAAKDAGPVEAQFCIGDETLVAKDKSIGFVDEVVMKAQKQTSAKYIRQAQFFQVGSCYVVEGTAVK